MSQILGIAAKENNNLTLGEAYFDKLPSGRSVAHDVIAWDNEIKPWKDYRSADKVGEKLLGNDNKTDVYSKYMDPIHSMFTLMDRPDYIEKNLSKFPRPWLSKASDTMNLFDCPNSTNCH